MCEMIKNGTARCVYIEELGVPYLINGAVRADEDDLRLTSGHRRNRPLRARHFANTPVDGVDVRYVETHPRATHVICPEKKPFSMLRIIVDMHTCGMWVEVGSVMANWSTQLASDVWWGVVPVGGT